MGTIDHPENLVTKSEKRFTFTLNDKEKIISTKISMLLVFKV